MEERHSFIIPIPSLQKKVEMHTSVLGRYRSSEATGHLMEQFSLTEGESFLFDDYLPEAAVKTYNWIRAFGRNVQNGYRVQHGSTPKLVRENDGFIMTMNGAVVGSKRFVLPITQDMYTIDVDGDMQTIHLHIPLVRIYKGDVDSFSFLVRVKYITIADNIFEDLHMYKEVMYSPSDIDIEDFDAIVEVSQAEFPTSIKDVVSMEICVLGDETIPQVFRAGDFIEFVRADGVHKYGVQQVTDTKIVVDEWYDSDLSNCVVFTVDLPEWMDRNMLPAAQEHLENALAFYIMYRWFETVQEPVYAGTRRRENLSDVFFAKWEESAHDAQLALNAEKRILQRKATWLQ